MKQLGLHNNAFTQSQLLAESGHFFAASLSPDLKVHFVNKHFADSFGLSQDPPFSWLEVLEIHPDDESDFISGFKIACERPSGKFLLSVRLRNPATGTFISTSWELCCVKDEDSATVVNMLGYKNARPAFNNLPPDDFRHRVDEIFENVTDGLYIIDREWRFLKVNPAACRLFGHAEDELIGRSIWEFFPDDETLVFPGEYRAAMKNNETRRFETFIEHLNRWFRTVAYPSKEGLTILFRDVTEEKETRRALQESENKLQSILASSTESFMLIGMDFTVLTCNQEIKNQTRRLLGKEIREGEDVRSYFPYFDERFRQKLQEAYQAAFKGQYVETEDAIDFGSMVNHFRMSIFPAFDQNNNQIGVVFRTITLNDQKEAERALRESQEKVKIISENIPGAIFQYQLFPDGSDQIKYMSEGCRKIWEVEPAEVESDAGILWRMVHPDDIKTMYRSVQESARDQSKWTHQWRIVTPGGSIKWLEATGMPSQLDDGSVLWNTVVMNVTVRKQAEQELIYSEHKLRGILDSTTESIVMIGRDFEVLTINKVAQWDTGTLLGRQIEEGDDFRDYLDFFTEDVAKVFYDSHERAMHGEVVDFERELDFGPFKRWYRFLYYPVKDESGSTIGVAFNTTDIESRKRSEERLVRQNELLKNITWQQSHEVRRPVANILGLVHLLKEQRSKIYEQEKVYIDKLEQSSMELDSIIQQIVETSEKHDVFDDITPNRTV